MNISTVGYKKSQRDSESSRLLKAVVCTLVAFVIFSQSITPAMTRQDGAEAGTKETLDLHSLYLSRHFFALRDQLTLPSNASSDDPRIGLYHAAVQSAFNQPGESNRIIKGLLERRNLPFALEMRLLRMELENDLRLADYKGALAAATRILSAPEDRGSKTPQAYARRMLPLLEALKDTPPQVAEKPGFSRLALGQTRRIPIEVSGKKRRFALDTGANFSVVMRSEAEKLDLEIRPANLKVSTSTTKEVLADVAVAEEMIIGKMRFQNVVFLVVPDQDLSFPGGERIPGLVGFPVVNAMDEVRFRRDDVLEIPRDPPRRSVNNLALNGLEPLVRARYNQDDLLCRLDTGAEKTDFYEPFFRRYRKRIEGNGKQVEVTRGGVGGYQDFNAYRLARFLMTIAGLDISLRRVDILTQPIRPAHLNYLDCNVGRDALEQFPAYVLNFRDMALILE
jgi:hypothetical protein